MNINEPDWDEADEDAFEGPDAYVEGDDVDEDIGDALEMDIENAQDDVETHDDGEPLPIAHIQALVFRERVLRMIVPRRRPTLNPYYRTGQYMDGEDESDEGGNNAQPRGNSWFQQVTKPQKAGMELLMSGEFGQVESKVRSRAGQRSIPTILKRRAASTRHLCKEIVSADLVPNTNGTVVANYDDNIYSGQFSSDSSFYYTCGQDFKLHIYDMTSSPSLKTAESIRQRRLTSSHGPSDHDTTMKVMKIIQGVHGQWTITDSHLSPNNERMIYSSITSTVYMTNIHEEDPAQIPLHFADNSRNRGWTLGDVGRFGIYSCRFSADGNEVIAGGNGNIFVYDLGAHKRTVKIVAHGDDVNSCCWADTASGNVLISASDDTFLKVWDRRSLGSSPKPSGVLIGHTEGITYVSAKGDGRYIISNGKDQAVRLWDLRKMRTNNELEAVESKHFGVSGYDYRYGNYRKPRYHAHPQDCSVMAYRGHVVFKTLIRCHFSPAETTGGQYIYSGSADGKIHIWSLDGQVVQILDRTHTLPIAFDPSAPEPPPKSHGRGHPVCVRDVSWHGKEPVILSAGWEGGRVGQSSVARHEWKGLGKMSLEDLVTKNSAEGEQQGERRSLRRSARLNSMPGHFAGITDDDDDEEDDENYTD
ncbi:WD40 repeat-like protein [Rickenella mellea]|uniref:WD40 repeat-like protein n=1 Tax=Rickenella mellea TaxID=50990 RepID=A0A4Y7QL09_9AGAM|nr:WD40 repeat-like protein [Rickenella mellea]